MKKGIFIDREESTSFNEKQIVAIKIKIVEIKIKILHLPHFYQKRWPPSHKNKTEK